MVQLIPSLGVVHLINISSVLARVPLATPRSAYSAAKAALNALTANLRMDLRAEHPNIHVSLVSPGPVATQFHNNALGGTPTGRGMEMQSVEEVVQVIEQVIDNPVPEVYTNPSAANLVRRYYQDIPAFEEELFARSKTQIHGQREATRSSEAGAGSGSASKRSKPL
jgi:short-subunit dehydrogenase